MRDEKELEGRKGGVGCRWEEIRWEEGGTWEGR
jgi:hypothetical protein